MNGPTISPGSFLPPVLAHAEASQHMNAGPAPGPLDGNAEEMFSLPPEDAQASLDLLEMLDGDSPQAVPPSPERLGELSDRFLAKAGEAPVSEVASRREEVAKKVLQVGEHMDTAAKAGVDITRSTFLRKVVGAVASLLALGVMVAATVATGGAAAPALAVACLSTLSYAGDAVCAWREWKNAQAQAAGQAPPYAPLPCGPSAVGNLAFWAIRDHCKDDASALSIAHKVELTFSVGLLAFSLATCVVPPELKLAEEAIKFASLGLKSMMYMHGTLASASHPQAGEGTLAEALEALDEALGPDEQARNDMLQDLIDSGEAEGGDTRMAEIVKQLLDKETGTFDPHKAAHWINHPLEHARHHRGPAWEQFLAGGVSVASMVLVGQKLPWRGSE